MVADLCVVGGYTQYAIRPARFLLPVPDGVDPRRGCVYPAGLPDRVPDAYPLPPATSGRNHPHNRRLGHGRHGAARSCAAFWSERHRHLLGLQYRCGRGLWCAGNRLSRRRLRQRGTQAHRRTARCTQGPRWRGCRLRCDRRRAFLSLVRLPCLRWAAVGYGSQTMADGREGLLSAGLGLARLKLWGAFSFLSSGRRAVWYSHEESRTQNGGFPMPPLQPGVPH